MDVEKAEGSLWVFQAFQRLFGILQCHSLGPNLPALA